MIRHTYEDRSKANILSLYKSLVRPHLEDCVQVWRPYLQQDIDNIESVQRRATKMIDGLQSKSYEERLKATGLISLEMRRLRADLIEVFKIVHGLEDLDPCYFFKFAADTVTNTRGHPYKIIKPGLTKSLMCRQYFFSQRVINEWNSLPHDAVTAKTVNSFKNHIKQLFVQNRGITRSQRWFISPVLTSTS